LIVPTLAGDLEDLMTAPQDQSEPAYMDVMPLEGEGPAAADSAPGAAFSPDAAAKYDAVMEFCLRRGQVLFTTLMTEFVNIHLGDLERCALLVSVNQSIAFYLLHWCMDFLWCVKKNADM